MTLTPFDYVALGVFAGLIAAAGVAGLIYWTCA